MGTTVLPCGHLIPIELPAQSAEASTSFIDTALAFWGSQTSDFHAAWEIIPRDQRNSIDSQWEDHIGSLPPRQNR